MKNPANCRKLLHPVGAFVVFEQAFGKKTALEYTKQCESKGLGVSFDLPQETIFNEVPKFRVATNPTNIIWENRHIKGKTKMKRNNCGVCVIFIFLFFSFFIIWAFQQMQLVYIRAHGDIDCDAIKQIYW